MAGKDYGKKKRIKRKYFKPILMTGKDYGKNESKGNILNQNQQQENIIGPTNQRKDLKPTLTIGKYYRNNKVKERI